MCRMDCRRLTELSRQQDSIERVQASFSKDAAECRSEIFLPSLDELSAKDSEIRWIPTNMKQTSAGKRNVLCRGSPIGPVGETDSSVTLENSSAPAGPSVSGSTDSSSMDVCYQFPNSVLSDSVVSSSDMSWPDDLDEPLFSAKSCRPLSDEEQLPDLDILCARALDKGLKGMDNLERTRSSFLDAPCDIQPRPKCDAKLCWTAKGGCGWHSALRVGVETLAAVLIVDRGELREGDEL
jgi:hypothetical protein